MMSTPKRYFVNKLPDYVGGSKNTFTQELFQKRCLDYVQTIFSNQKVSQNECEGGLYVGLAGVSYMCYYLSKHPAFLDKKQEFLEKSEFYLNHTLAYEELPKVKGDRSMKAAFLLGSAGTLAVASVISKALGKENECQNYVRQYSSLASGCVARDYLGCGSDELLVGRAGYLSGVLYLQKELRIQVLSDEQIFELCEATVKSGMEYSKRVKSPCPLMYSYHKTEYLGAAHGLCGILQILLCFPKYLQQNPAAEEKIKESVDFLLKLQTPEGNFPCAMDEVSPPRSESNELLHWCHGAPGVIYLMAKAYLHWKEEKYLQSCILCGEIVWKKGLLRKGPGICHGVAGSGYVFLLLFRLTREERHLHRAIQFSEFLFSEEFKSAKRPDRPLSLYEGIAGTVCFLADVLNVENAHFPFFDVL